MDDGDYQAQADEEEFVGRYVDNALGEKEIVFLSQRYWDYIDWIDESGLDVAAYIRTCDLSRKDCPLSNALAWNLYWTWLAREKAGLPKPDWLGPPEPWEHDED